MTKCGLNWPSSCALVMYGTNAVTPDGAVFSHDER